MTEDIDSMVPVQSTNEYEKFIRIFEAATEAIPKEYFQLPVAEKVDPIYRERVYCYELYHQLRSKWDNLTFSLTGEIDKAGHPTMKAHYIANTKPDFLVHQPGNMDSNLVIIEVKPICANIRGIKKDLKTLSAYKQKANYKHAILLIYGNRTEQSKKFWHKVKHIKEQSYPLETFDIYYHINANEKVKKVDIGTID